MKWLLFMLLCGCGNRDMSVPADAAPDSFVADDGTPTRVACTSNFGNKLTAAFGRLDGYLVSIVAPTNQNGCNADSSHVHLQIKMQNEIYDVAVDATDGSTNMDDVHSTEIDMPLPAPGWAEGWHTGVIVDYTSWGVHSTDMPLQTKQQVVDTLNTDLAAANHVSVYMTGYGPDGGHLVHRNGSGHDGLIVSAPLSGTSHFRLLNFTDVNF